MHFLKSFLLLAPFALSAFAQSATIVSPTNGTSVTSGSELVIAVRQEVRRPSLSFYVPP